MRHLLLAGAFSVCLSATIGSNSGFELQGTVRVGDRPTARAAVWLSGPRTPAPAPGGTVVLDQRNLSFNPHVLIVRVGTTVELPNNDRVLHNVFSFRDGKRFDLGLYPVGTVRRVTFDHVGLSRIFCNIHPNMAAYVLVVDTPYFGLSGEDGRFSIPSVPAGTYAYHAWRPGADELTGPASVDERAALDIRWP